MDDQIGQLVSRRFLGRYPLCEWAEPVAPEDERRVDHHQLGAGTLVLDEVPGGALRDRLGARVGMQSWGVRVGPVGLRVVGARLGRVADCCEGRGQHHAPGAGSTSGTQHAERAITSGHDQLVRILWLDHRRGDVVDPRTAGHRAGPAVVSGQVRDDNLQASVVGAATAHCLAQPGLAVEGPDRGAHRGPIPQQCSDQLRAHIARTTGDQHRTHRATSIRLTASRTRSQASASAISSPRSRASHTAAFSRR